MITKQSGIFMLLFSMLLIGCTPKTKQTLKENTINNPLLGSWKMQEIHYIYADTTYIGKPITYGTLLFTPKRYSLLYNPWTSARQAFKVLSKPTDAEIKAAFQSIVFNSGSYIFTDSTVTTTADTAKVPGFEGGKQYYKYTLRGNDLSIIMFDETYPNGAKPDWFGKMKVKFKMIKE